MRAKPSAKPPHRPLPAARGAAPDAASAGGLAGAAADPLSGSAFVCRSGKLAVAQALLLRLLRQTDEKVVVVCRFLKTLALLRAVCAREGVEALYLDGSTAAAGRQELVEAFNVCGRCRADGAFRQSGSRACPHGEAGARVFLLTARAGGVGLTIVGASRMLIVEPDWNPAVDLQAMGRIYREGQARPTHLYRLFAASSIEEKILQRQLAKRDVADEVIDAAAAEPGREARTAGFSREDLRALFAPHAPLRGTCETVELLAPTAEGARAPLSAAAAADPLLAALHADARAAGGALAHACSWAELEAMRRDAAG